MYFTKFEDTTLHCSPVGSRPPTPKSDTECEYVDRKGNVASDSEELQQWNWGELPDSSQIVTQHTDDPETEDMTQNPQGMSQLIAHSSRCSQSPVVLIASSYSHCLL